MENSRRKVVIYKVRAAYHAYRQMLHYYAVKNLLDYLAANPAATLESMAEQLAGPRERDWVNLGGQLAPAPEVERLLTEIKTGNYRSWPEIHQAYDALWSLYPLQKQRHAFATLLDLLETDTLTTPTWNSGLDDAVRIQEYIRDEVFLTRDKDYRNRFRQTTFRNAAEMQAVIGTAEDNSFVKLLRRQTEDFFRLVQAVKARLARPLVAGTSPQNTAGRKSQ
jgi:hypothetical protein